MDLNKTQLTQDVTDAAEQWLFNIGAKPVEKETYINRGWLADLAAIWSPTRTEAQNQKLIPRNLRGNAYMERNEQRERLFAELPSIITICHEVKTARADYLSDKKFGMVSPTNMCVLSVVEGVVKNSAYPANWWILLHSQKTGSLIKVLQRASFRTVTDSRRLSMVSQLAMRTWNRTTFKQANETQRRIHDGERERKGLLRIRQIAQAFQAILHGEHESVENCFQRHLNYRDRRQIPDYILEDAKELFGKCKEHHDTRHS